MTEHTFDTGVPVPPRVPSAGRSHFMWFMKPGDSKFIPAADIKEASLRATARVVRKRSDGERQFTVRKQTESGVPGYRVWRL